MKCIWKMPAYAMMMLAAMGASVISLRFFVIPYAWICFMWCAICVYTFIHTQRERARVVSFNIGAVFLLLGVFEIFSYAQDRETLQLIERRNSLHDECRNEEGELTTRRRDHDILGYAPVRQKLFQKRYAGDDLIYDVSWTIDADGLRVSPPYREDANPRSILFFGCSYTFGDGVNDEETMPYVVGLKTGAKYRIYNFGWCGYGPHQMLAAIEHGMVSDIVECEPAYVIFTAIVDHTFRCAGRAVWDWDGPKYVVDGKGEVVYQGHFDDGKGFENAVVRKAKLQLRKSHLISRFFLKSINKNDVKLMVAIIDAAKKAIKADYPQCEFHVMMWDKKNMWISDEILSGLKVKGIEVHLVSEILPDYLDTPARYQLSEIDDHPNQLAYELLAEYVSREIIGR